MSIHNTEKLSEQPQNADETSASSLKSANEGIEEQAVIQDVVMKDVASIEEEPSATSPEHANLFGSDSEDSDNGYN